MLIPQLNSTEQLDQVRLNFSEFLTFLFQFHEVVVGRKYLHDHCCYCSHTESIFLPRLFSEFRVFFPAIEPNFHPAARSATENNRICVWKWWITRTNGCTHERVDEGEENHGNFFFILSSFFLSFSPAFDAMTLGKRKTFFILLTRCLLEGKGAREKMIFFIIKFINFSLNLIFLKPFLMLIYFYWSEMNKEFFFVVVNLSPTSRLSSQLRIQVEFLWDDFNPNLARCSFNRLSFVMRRKDATKSLLFS